MKKEPNSIDIHVSHDDVIVMTRQKLGAKTFFSALRSISFGPIETIL